ncbi:MAG: SufD family Fe-S cluster assembly protein [Eubacterium sp.]|nr:SufD family Fe-S cluster assembly protein [Eubacterium sp.]
MTTQNTIRVNALPAPTWRWLRLNDTAIALPEEVSEALVEATLPEMEEPAFTEEEYSRLTGLETGMGAEFQQYTASAPVDIFRWKAAAGVKIEEPLVARVFATEGESTVNRFFFSAEEGSEMTIVMDLTKETPPDGMDTVSYGANATDPAAEADTASAPLSVTTDTRIYVHKNAKVRLIQVSRTAEAMASYVDVGAYVEEKGSLDILQLTLGGRSTFFGIAVDLAGTESHLNIETGFQAGEGQHVDINYVARHHGVKTDSNMNVRGVLWKGASKTWRATVDFLRGCKGARGAEREDVLLLDEDVVNKTIPLILCQEEDVEGEHGATIGDLSDDVLLYFRSRGIDDATAYQLMAKGRLIGCVRQIPDAALRAELLQELGEEVEAADEE